MDYVLNEDAIKKHLLRAHNPARISIRKRFFEKEYTFFRNHIKDKTVLVAGSGLGDDSFELAKYNKKVIGVEILPTLVKESKKKLRKATFKNIQFKKGDITNLPYKNNNFDVVVLNMGTIGNFPNKPEVIKELLRVSNKIYLDFYLPTKKALMIRKKMYEEELWKNITIKGKTVISSDGLESTSISKSELTKIVKLANAKVKYYPICDFTIMAEIYI